ncbi:MAG TPA: hypothetical protein VNW47_11655 [Terriglobales bacterium]|jgi:hypothetical protein|nr:hypothetical protein [Terriglobales bacterium]
MTVDTLTTLRNVNNSLRSAMFRFRSDQKNCSTITAQNFAGLLSEILSGAECLRLQPIHSDTPELVRQAALDYRGNLEKLRDFLPELHSNLLAEKSRLEAAQAHVSAAAAWARSSTKTL